MTYSYTGGSYEGGGAVGTPAAPPPFVLTNITTQVQQLAVGGLDIPYTTVTGNILLRIVCGDTASTVDDPWVLTYDIPGANIAFTIQKFASGGQASGRAKLVIATIRGVPVTGVPKNIHFQTAAGNVAAMTICIADLPAAWTGAVGNSDASAVNTVKNTHTSPAIVTIGTNSLLVACGGCVDATVGSISISGQGGTWAPNTAQFISGSGATGYNGLYASKTVAASGATVDFTVTIDGAATSANWAAGQLEIRP